MLIAPIERETIMPLYANEYQWKVGRTLPDIPELVYTDYEIMMVRYVLGLLTASGACADNVQRAVFEQHGISRDQLAIDLGMVLWHVTALCTSLDLNLSEIMDRNIAHMGEGAA